MECKHPPCFTHRPCCSHLSHRFLLSQLYFESISTKTTLRKIKDALKNLPTGLKAYDHAYDEAMKRIASQDADSKDLARQVLSWITCAKTRLTPLGLQHALAVNDGDSEIDEENLPLVEDMVSVCVGLVVIDEESEIIRLVHYTTQEYFQRTQKDWSPSAQTDMAKVCATYLSFSIFDGGFDPTEKGIQAWGEDNLLFEYAARSWVLHARCASPAADLVISSFLSSGSKIPSSTLLWAARNEQQLIVEWLLGRPVDVNVRDVEWKTPLHHAVLHGWTNCVELLLDRGAELTVDIDNMTPLHYTVSTENEEIAEIFLRAGVPVDNPVIRRVWLGTFVEGKYIYVLKDDPKCPVEVNSTSRGLTALHYAALTGSVEMTTFLLEHGADPNAVSEDGETPLHLAVRQDLHGFKRNSRYSDRWNHGDFRIEMPLDHIPPHNSDCEEEFSSTWRTISYHRLLILDALLTHPGIDVNARDRYGASPLHSFNYGKWSFPTVLERLLSENINVSIRNFKGQTPLHIACLAGDVDSIRILVEHGANAIDVDKDGLNAIHCAVRSRNEECISVLLALAKDAESTALVMARDNHGRNALHHLFGKGITCNHGAVGSLLSSGVGVNDLDEAGNSPLATYLAESRSFNDVEVVRFLFQSGADPSLTNNEGLGLGHLAAKAHKLDTELFRILASYGVDPQMQDANGRTILHHLAMEGYLTKDALDYFCGSVGLSRHTPDAFGSTPLNYADERSKKFCDPKVLDQGGWSETEDFLLCL